MCQKPTRAPIENDVLTNPSCVPHSGLVGCFSKSLYSELIPSERGYTVKNVIKDKKGKAMKMMKGGTEVYICCKPGVTGHKSVAPSIGLGAGDPFFGFSYSVFPVADGTNAARTKYFSECKW